MDEKDEEREMEIGAELGDAMDWMLDASEESRLSMAWVWTEVEERALNRG